MTVNGINLDDHTVRAFCTRHGIARLSLFGSILGKAFGPDSDVDVLVEFEPGRRVSLFDLGGMAVELSEAFGRQVDLRTPQDLSRHFRDQVVRDARPVYAG